MARPPRHGMTGTPTFISWSAMIARCSNPKTARFKYYLGKGITVCPGWQRFENFLADMGERPNGKTLERLDSSRGYYPANCVWATPKEQALNRPTTRMITAGYKTQSLTDWARQLNIQPSAIRWRIQHGWGEEQAVTYTPRRDKRRDQRKTPI